MERERRRTRNRSWFFSVLAFLFYFTLHMSSCEGKKVAFSGFFGGCNRDVRRHYLQKCWFSKFTTLFPHPNRQISKDAYSRFPPNFSQPFYLFILQFQADELHLRAGRVLSVDPAAGDLGSRIPGGLAPAGQVVPRAPDAGAAAHLPQADQVPGHLQLCGVGRVGGDDGPAAQAAAGPLPVQPGAVDPHPGRRPDQALLIPGHRVPLRHAGEIAWICLKNCC